MAKSLWTILVPSERPAHHDGHPFFRTRYHRVWDQKVRDITGGLTILPPTKGQWLSPSGELFSEKMIPVMVAATRNEVNKIIDMTIEYYDQQAVFCYKVSDEVIIRHR